MICNKTLDVTDKLECRSISIIIVNWNSGELLVKCLEHLAVQTVQPNQVLIIDNASSDNSVDYIDCTGNVSLQKIDRNLGFAAGNNFLLDGCNSEFIVLLNPDAFPEAEWLENLLIAASDNPDVAAFGSQQLIQSKPEYVDGVGDSYHLSGLVWRECHGARQQTVGLNQKEIFSPCAAAALYRRQAVMDAGGFDEDYFCYVEDVDLGFRLRLLGHQAMYVANAVVHHVGSATTGGQHSDFAVYHGHRNLVWTFIKNMPSILFWALLPIHLMMNIAVLILFSLRGQGRVIFKSKWDALMGVPLAWRKRKLIQASRTVGVVDIWRLLNKKVIPFSRFKRLE